MLREYRVSLRPSGRERALNCMRMLDRLLQMAFRKSSRSCFAYPDWGWLAHISDRIRGFPAFEFPAQDMVDLAARNRRRPSGKVVDTCTTVDSCHTVPVLPICIGARPTAKILAGRKPAELPVEQPIRLELAINRGTEKGAAKRRLAAGSVLRAATELIAPKIDILVAWSTPVARAAPAASSSGAGRASKPFSADGTLP